MKLIAINIQNNFHNAVVLDFLKKENPDVLCLQELLEEEVEFFKKEMEMEGKFQAIGYIRGVTYPTIKEKKYGIGIFAKKIIESGSEFYAGQEKNIIKSFEEYMSDENFRKNRALVWIKMEDKNKIPFTIITSHLPDTYKGETTPYQIEVVSSFMKSLEKFKEFIFCGDTNAPRGKEAFSLIAQKYKDNIPSEYTTSIDQNLHRVKDLQNMVDGLFTTPTYKASDVKLIDGLSDHMAIVAEITKN